MKALSIRQPWAWLIVMDWKPVENRTWCTKHRGPTLIHAAKGMTREEYEAAKLLAWRINSEIVLPEFYDLERGGIVGMATLTDVANFSFSHWFSGPYGFVMDDPKPLPFVSLKGQLGFFEVSDTLLPALCLLNEIGGES